MPQKRHSSKLEFGIGLQRTESAPGSGIHNISIDKTFQPAVLNQFSVLRHFMESTTPTLSVCRHIRFDVRYVCGSGRLKCRCAAGKNASCA